MNLKIEQKASQNQRIYILCLNPYCLKPDERCLSSRNLHDHPPECSQFYYPAEQIIQNHWSSLQKYPIDSLGAAVKRKFKHSQQKSYLSLAIADLRAQFQSCMRQLQQKLSHLYPQKELSRCYSSVYGLEKVAESLKAKLNPKYISKLINQNFSSQNYHGLLRLNQNYDQLRGLMDSVGSKLFSGFDGLLHKQKAAQMLPHSKTNYKKINYGIYKSKFIASLKIEVDKTVVHFPKIQSIASFLPWIYTDRYFTEGIHEFKITSLRFPIVQNAGFTVLDQHDIDTYPYSYFKSLFNREGKGFKLVKGEQIDQFVAQTTVVRLRLQLCGDPKAILYDSEMQCQYECKLQQKKTYRMGVYGCGWAIQILQLS